MDRQEDAGTATPSGGPLRDYPCIRCGTPIDDCWEGHRCCDDSDHPFATSAETIKALNEELSTERDAPIAPESELRLLDGNR